MDYTAIVGGLVAAIVGMSGFFVFIMKDERARNERLLSRLDEQNKLVLNAIDVLGKAVETVHGKQQLYEVIGKLNEVKETLGGLRQVYEAIDNLHSAVDLIEQQSQPKRQPRSGGGNENSR